jgi:serine/threonine protein kinase
MSTLVTCPKGHQWEVVPTGGPAAAPRTTCPVCGSSPIPDIPQLEDEDELTAVGTVRTPPVPPPLTVFSGELASTLSPPRPDSLILGLARGSGYELLEPIGRGGMGVVYRARQQSLKRIVALKMLPGDFPDDPTARGRFRTEAEAAARLQHPNIVQIYEVGEHEGRPFFSMEYVEGGNLAKKLSRGLMPVRQAAEMVECLARAVHYAHERGIAHRDLKPSNVLLTPDGIPKIADFGLAKRIAGGSTASEQNDQTRTGEILGTPSYMAPEQASGQTKEAGASADVYALGAILYELLTGRPPFEGKTSLQALYRVLHEDPIPPLQVQPRRAARPRHNLPGLPVQGTAPPLPHRPGSGR